MGYHVEGPTPIQDLITSAVLGGILGFSVFVIAEATGIVDSVLRSLELSEIRRRIDMVQFVIAGVILGVVLDLIGKLAPRRSGASAR